VDDHDNDDFKHSVFQIYVLPPIDKFPKSHPHAEKINKIVAEEKSKLEDVSEVLSKRELAMEKIPPEDLPSHKMPVQTKHSTGKDNFSSDKANQYTSPGAGSSMDVVCSRILDHTASSKPQHPENSSFSTAIQIGGAEVQKQIPETKAGSFVPLTGGSSSSFNGIMEMQTCSQCHKLLCGEMLRKVSSESVKVICKKCMDNCPAPENSPNEKVVTLYRCGICFVDFFERDILVRHMDEKHELPPEPTSDIVTKTSTECVSNTHTIITNQIQGPAMPADMEMLCPPTNLVLQNIVLQPRPAVQTLPLTFNSQSILVNAAHVFTLQPSNVPALLTTAPQTSTFVAPAEVLVDPGKVLLPTHGPKVAIPKLNSVSKATDNRKILPKDSTVENTEVRASSMQLSE
jgi:hypothetical protein